MSLYIVQPQLPTPFPQFSCMRLRSVVILFICTILYLQTIVPSNLMLPTDLQDHAYETPTYLVVKFLSDLALSCSTPPSTFPILLQKMYNASMSFWFLFFLQLFFCVLY